MNELLLLTPLLFSFYVHEGEVDDDNDNDEEAAELIKSTWLWPQRMWKGSARVVSTPNGSLDSMAPQVMEAHIVKGPDDLIFFTYSYYQQITGQSALMHMSCRGNRPAHLLARYALSIANFFVWIEEVPCFLEQALTQDVIVAFQS